MEPTILGNRYELQEKIGEGGMSYVYRARCQILDRIVAIKILKEEYSKDQAFVGRFKTEAMAAARLSHSNIVNIYDVGQQDDVYYIVMEYIEGKTLKDLIAEEAPLPVGRAIDIAVMICDGIQHAHEKGIIHRDIKPHNILITTSGMVKVADFGIAQAISKKTITFGGNIVGSVHYISPEQAKGEPLTVATDIYSLGCVLYEMLTGKTPFDAESPVTVALKHIHDEVVSPRQINESIPMALEGIIYRAMEKVPEKRFPSAEKMRNDLLNMNGAYAGYKPGHAGRDTIVMPPITTEGTDAMVKKRKLRTAGVYVIIALLGLFFGMIVMLGGNFFGQEVVVPDIVGQNINQADKELDKLKLIMDVKDKKFNDEFKKDEIIFQEPGKGQKVKEGKHIEVILSLGSEKIKVPNVVGKELADAEIIIGNEGFEIGIDKIYDDKYKEGYIISQEPRAGTRVAKNSKIDLMVSKGPTPDKIPMPKLIGLTLEEAQKQIQDSKLVLGEVTKKDSNDYYADQVIEQDTKAEVMVEEGTTVNLVVSKGPGPVAQTQMVEIPLPRESDYYAVVIIQHDAKGKKKIYDQLHVGGDTVNLMVNYFGNASLDIQLNGKPYRVRKL
ncbi:MAG: protein kinase [Syntrophomonadaceae bacterium]|nr:protein kinase [Syntrophomonadaceae bacterium]MDD3270510.1 protein kinase [Syntrophomonadaceae bacterium]MDD3898487.1 protein kinase [Syntrophomonadaceae bacterium]MDD4561554.1 protein kinase [Syntrophomonadaceae bacterium]